MPEVGDVISPWIHWGGVTVPGWLLIRPELSLGAKLLAAMIMEEDDIDPEEGIAVPAGVEDPVGKYTGLYSGDREEVRSWLEELGRLGLLLLDKEDKTWVRFPESWEDPSYHYDDEGNLVLDIDGGADE